LNEGALRHRRGNFRARADTQILGRYVLGGWLGFALWLALLLPLDTLEDLFPMDGNVLRCIDTNSHLIALHPKDGDGDIVTDHHGFTHPSRQYEHLFFLLDLGLPDVGQLQESAERIYGFAPMRQIRENLKLSEIQEWQLVRCNECHKTLQSQSD
jgi:hypothetical protein